MSNILESINRGLENKYFGDILDEAVYGGRKWSNLSDEERQECLNADPTYNGKEDSAGKYSEWILKTYSDFKKNHPNEKFRFEHCKDVLNQFVRSRDNLRDTSKKDINQFKSPDELDSFLNNSQSFKNTFVEVPNEGDIKDAKKVFENNRCEIWVPLTHAASVALAGEPKTKWCTAYSNPSYYDDYMSKGPLYILIMKDGSGDMYQFHFGTRAAMDKNDDWVPWNDFPEVQEARKNAADISDKIEEEILKRDERGKSLPGMRDHIKELQNPALVKKWEKRHDAIVCKELDKWKDVDWGKERIDSKILDVREGAMMTSFYKVNSLTSTLYDDKLVDKYGAAANKAILDNFYHEAYGAIDDDIPAVAALLYLSGKVDLVIPDEVTKIGERCFYGCSALRSVTIPNSVTVLGKQCFCACNSLESITIPKSVIDIRECAFNGCSSLKKVIIEGDIGCLPDSCFSGCLNLSEIRLPDSITEIEKGCFLGCESLKSIKIPDGVSELPDKCFYGCDSLEHVNLPRGLQFLGRECFCETGIKEINLPKTLKTISQECFAWCKSLEKIDIPDSVTNIGIECFDTCTSLKSVRMKDSLRWNTRYAFTNCGDIDFHE